MASSNVGRGTLEAGAALVTPKLNAKTEVQVDVQVNAMKMATMRGDLVMFAILRFYSQQQKDRRPLVHFCDTFFNNKVTKNKGCVGWRVGAVAACFGTWLWRDLQLVRHRAFRGVNYSGPVGLRGRSMVGPTTEKEAPREDHETPRVKKFSIAALLPHHSSQLVGTFAC